MKKSMITGITVMSIGILSVLKTTLGDEVTELTGEESMEKILNIQEENEQGEYGENESNEIGEYGK